MIRQFCTYFDRNYFTRGIALYHSLKRHCPAFRLWILCLDEVCYERLSRLDLPGVRLISIEDFERDDAALRATKENRSLLEYYFTCTPSLPLYIFRHDPSVELITYLDADLYFYSDPQPLFDEMGTNSVAIIGHRFPPEIRELEKYGIYNVGFLSFRNDANGLECLRWWRERCIEWCYSRLENGCYGDQKYLDDWPVRFDQVSVLHHKGANVAGWNLANYQVTHTGNRVWMDDQPLIFFHFHGLQFLRRWLINLNVAHYEVRPSQTVIRKIFTPYLRDLLEGESAFPSDDLKGMPTESAEAEASPSIIQRIIMKKRAAAFVGANILKRNYAIVFNGHALPISDMLWKKKLSAKPLPCHESIRQTDL